MANVRSPFFLRFGFLFGFGSLSLFLDSIPNIFHVGCFFIFPPLKICFKGLPDFSSALAWLSSKSLYSNDIRMSSRTVYS